MTDPYITDTHFPWSGRASGHRHVRRKNPQRNQDNATGETSNRLESAVRSGNITKLSTEAAKQRVRKKSQHNKGDSKRKDLCACRTSPRTYELRQKCHEEQCCL